MNFWHTIFWISYAAWALFEFWVFGQDRRAVRKAGGRMALPASIS